LPTCFGKIKMLASWFEAFRIALHNLAANKLRTVLTLLGIAVGVMAVIAVTALISGLDRQVSQNVMSQGANVFSVRRLPQIILSRDDFLKLNKRKEIRTEDAGYLVRNCRSCRDIGWVANTSRSVRYGNDVSDGVLVRGVSESIIAIEEVNFAAGRQFTSQEIAAGNLVCVLGWDVVQNLFIGVEPVGKEVRIAGVPFRVIGVAEPLGEVFGFSRDSFVMIPLTAYEKLFVPRPNLTLVVAANSPETIERTAEEVRQLLRARRHRSFRDEDDGFTIETSQVFLDFYRNIANNIYLVSLVISSISLVVGGIVIMNIMLVSVTERTREIGIRKALGARRRDILGQFLIEALTVSALGGALGTLAGYGVAYLISSYTGFPLYIDPNSALMGVMVAALVGIVFGVYPATRAARLDPIEALRAE
jgi:putative ABC transport system permease protein